MANRVTVTLRQFQAWAKTQTGFDHIDEYVAAEISYDVDLDDNINYTTNNWAADYREWLVEEGK